VLGCPLAINPVNKTDAVAEVASTITPLNPQEEAHDKAPYVDLMNLGMGMEDTGDTSGIGMSSISGSAPDLGSPDGTWLSSSTTPSGPSFGSVATDLAVGGIAHRASHTIKENAEAMKAKYDDLRGWCDTRFQQMELALREQNNKTQNITTQLTEVTANQGEADQRARLAESRQEQNQTQLMNMLQGLTRLATGGSGPAALLPADGSGALSFAFPPQPQLLAAAGDATSYGPTALTNSALPAPYGKASAPPPPGGSLNTLDRAATGL
jgi:hypothetical protein